MKEQWIKWEPIANLAPKYYIDKISHTIKDFHIILSEDSSTERKIKILFEDSVDAYRDTDESFRRKLIYDLGQTYGSNFYGKWTFFKVYNSKYLQWLSEESFEITNSLGFIHFSLIAADSILDIVTTYEPKIIIMNENNE